MPSASGRWHCWARRPPYLGGGGSAVEPRFLFPSPSRSLERRREGIVSELLFLCLWGYWSERMTHASLLLGHDDGTLREPADGPGRSARPSAARATAGGKASAAAAVALSDTGVLF